MRNSERLIDSYISAKTHHSLKLIIDPYDFAAQQLFEYKQLDKTIKSYEAAEKCLDEMSEGQYNDKQIANIMEACAGAKTNFVAGIKKNNEILYEHCTDKSKGFESNKYKLKQNCVYSVIKDWIMTFPGYREMKLEDVDWNRIDIFLNTYFKFVNNKPKSPKPNSMIDLLNFLYLMEHGYIYWSEEKEFLELVRQAYGDYIPAFIYPDGKMVKKIFKE